MGRKVLDGTRVVDLTSDLAEDLVGEAVELEGRSTDGHGGSEGGEKGEEGRVGIVL